MFNQDEVLNVIKVLRGNNDTADNCTHVSSDLIEYFKTGIISNAESSTVPSTLEDFDVVTMSDWIKKENGSKYLGMVKSIVCLNNTKISDIPYNKLPSELEDGTLDLDQEIYDVDNFTQFTSSTTEINGCLKKKAEENEKGVSFGFICIGRCGKYIDIPGHMLTYFATNENVWYVDCQLYDGINDIDNGCIFSDLTSAYQFANSKRITIDVFGEYVFYIPIGPKIQCEELVSIKLENMENIESVPTITSKKQYKYECEHGKNKYRCKLCGGSEICEHGHIKYSCKECGVVPKKQYKSKCEHGKRKYRCKLCGGSEICEHDRQKSACKECKGGSICEHNRVRSACKECKGGAICEHNRNKSICKDCKGSAICEHGKRKYRCKDCGGNSICKHGRIRSDCKDCKGTGICEHNRKKSECKQCGGGAICKHDHIRSTCKECKGGAICKHDRVRSSCIECKGSAVCEHNRQRRSCKDCKGKSLCEHGLVKYVCKECKGGSICEHGKRRTVCVDCKGGAICEHEKEKAKCKICKQKRKSNDDSILVSPKRVKKY